jgi:hypothetical protein
MVGTEAGLQQRYEPRNAQTTRKRMQKHFGRWWLSFNHGEYRGHREKKKRIL